MNLSKDTVRYLNVISERSIAIGVRGEFTKNVLESYGINNARVIGCPSNFLNPDVDLHKRLDTAFSSLLDSDEYLGKIAFYPQLGAHLRDEENHLSESKIFQLCKDNNASYVVNAPENFIGLARGRYDEIEAKHIRGLHKKIGVQYDYSEFASFLYSNSKTFTSISDWLEYSSRLLFSAGKRIHGALNTLQTGKPGIIIYHDSRTRELAETIGVPRISSSNFEKISSIDNLLTMVEWSAAEYRDKRSSLWSEYKAIFQDNGLKLPYDLSPREKNSAIDKLVPALAVGC